MLLHYKQNQNITDKVGNTFSPHIQKPFRNQRIKTQQKIGQKIKTDEKILSLV